MYQRSPKISQPKLQWAWNPPTPIAYTASKLIHMFEVAKFNDKINSIVNEHDWPSHKTLFFCLPSFFCYLHKNFMLTLHFASQISGKNYPQDPHNLYRYGLPRFTHQGTVARMSGFAQKIIRLTANATLLSHMCFSFRAIRDNDLYHIWCICISEDHSLLVIFVVLVTSSCARTLPTTHYEFDLIFLCFLCLFLW